MHYNVYIYIIIYLIRLGIYHDTKRVSPWQDTISQPSRSSRPVAASGRIICDGCSVVLLQEAWHVSELGVSFWIMLDTLW